MMKIRSLKFVPTSSFFIQSSGFPSRQHLTFNSSLNRFFSSLNPGNFTSSTIPSYSASLCLQNTSFSLFRSVPFNNASLFLNEEVFRKKLQDKEMDEQISYEFLNKKGKRAKKKHAKKKDKSKQITFR